MGKYIILLLLKNVANKPKYNQQSSKAHFVWSSLTKYAEFLDINSHGFQVDTTRIMTFLKICTISLLPEFVEEATNYYERIMADKEIFPNKNGFHLYMIRNYN
ncbi:hypothetical protein RF11_11277 [Thelohanellus kitauei]|uniref:Uncharacterized protein n=1 Tax=Thelohanellus kitauei TaxID=669202 RepID=A0A0C2IWE7_THEKT|nr:hypothetical protein RF11_11277 [Thelohanellus kitauei]